MPFCKIFVLYRIDWACSGAWNNRNFPEKA